MGLAKDDLVLEVGHDSDCDSTLRDQIMSITGTTFLEGSTNEVVDAVIIWWREGDGDLVDELMDALTYLVEKLDAHRLTLQQYRWLIVLSKLLVRADL